MAENRVTSVGAEVLRTGPASARVTSVGAEVLRSGPSNALVSSVAIEVLRSVAGSTTTEIPVGPGALIYTGNAVVASESIYALPGKGELTYTGKPVTTALARSIAVGKDEVSYSGLPVTLQTKTYAEPGHGSVTYAGYPAHIVQIAAPGRGQLIYSGKAAHILKVDVSQAGAAYVFDSYAPNAVVSQAGTMAVYSWDDAANIEVSQAGALVVYDYVPCATTWCQVWIIYRLDGEVLAYTSLDEDITFMGYDAKHCGSLNPTATEGAADLDSVGNYELTGIISDDGISEHDLWAGAYDGAYVEAWLVDWSGEDTPRRLAAGTAGKVSQGDSFTMEVLGMGGKLQQQAVIPVATAKCRWQFGKGQCPVNVAAITQTAPVTYVGNRRVVKAAALVGYVAHPFVGGLVTALTGDNAGFQSEIKTFNAADGTFVMWVPAPYPWQVGDSLAFAPGCDQLVATCKSYGAFADFGGYPDVPGDDAMNESPDAVYDT